jgi:trehalose/maltose hydrolase-like predicted phosphorylase
VSGALEEGMEELQRATLFAGVFNRLPKSSDLGDGESPALVVGPNWLKLSIWIGDEPLSLKHGEALEHEPILDMWNSW